MKNNNICILVDNDSWILSYAEKLQSILSGLGYVASLVRKAEHVSEGFVNFMLGCTNIVSKNVLEKNKHNLVVHESALPLGRGFSPMSWQIIEGKSEIPICLLEADENVDAGQIWIQDSIELNGTELVNDWRALQGEKTVELCLLFLKNYESLKPISQAGVSTWYRRRTTMDSILDINKSLSDQFNLLRTVDNEKYPAFFEFAGKTYLIKIEKLDK
ncbi:formyltransferase family protein [Polynucleobacter sp. AM-26B4]|uniref:formyltransferase family protein n=1 Tax=Polynucleobacter sp. AM-26B4 TaxID=2689103 RepID=UPI001C0BD80C|nr:formyltransferase family protein [Polynucleobacter sp. AM-26B4]MBU3585139.1 methionyl-tRNA formyltransferase [Polynucleobacter sp. AM-26B4]